ncbi:MAG TPA: hypothetical protein VLE93_02750 [Candidatus Saccharimonadales bacterium]|nr:hypothetical protein [Candidatus Saccharimonadales bacterium]
MGNLLKSQRFWIATGSFLVLAGALLYFTFPPLWRTFQSQRSRLSDLNAQISSQTQYIATIKSLTAQPDTVNSLYQKATELLPPALDSDLLALQLDGLLASLNLSNLTVTVPFAATGTVAPSVTLTGAASFSQAQTLIAALKTFGRWNKITSIDLAQTGQNSTVTVSTSVFFRAAKAPEFSGSNTKLLTQAATLFKGYQTYATAPNVTQEGDFGRTDPFASTP